MTDLGTLAGGTSSSADDINLAGQVVGFSSGEGDNPILPTLWTRK
jgi:uncharacterized membrane protein